MSGGCGDWGRREEAGSSEFGVDERDDNGVAGGGGETEGEEKEDDKACVRVALGSVLRRADWSREGGR